MITQILYLIANINIIEPKSGGRVCNSASSNALVGSF